MDPRSFGRPFSFHPALRHEDRPVDRERDHNPAWICPPHPVNFPSFGMVPQFLVPPVHPRMFERPHSLDVDVAQLPGPITGADRGKGSPKGSPKEPRASKPHETLANEMARAKIKSGGLRHEKRNKKNDHVPIELALNDWHDRMLEAFAFYDQCLQDFEKVVENIKEWADKCTVDDLWRKKAEMKTRMIAPDTFDGKLRIVAHYAQQAQGLLGDCNKDSEDGDYAVARQASVLRQATVLSDDIVRESKKVSSKLEACEFVVHQLGEAIRVLGPVTRKQDPSMKRYTVGSKNRETKAARKGEVGSPENDSPITKDEQNDGAKAANPCSEDAADQQPEEEANCWSAE